MSTSQSSASRRLANHLSIIPTNYHIDDPSKHVAKAVSATTTSGKPGIPLGKIIRDFQNIEFTVSSILTPQQEDIVSYSISEFIRQVLAYGQNWGVIIQAVQADPGCPLALLLAADYFIACEDIASAVQCRDKARACAAHKGDCLTPRDRLYLDAYSTWMAGDLAQSFTLFENITKAYPNDLFAAKRGQLLAFLMGSTEKMVSILERPSVIKACSTRPYYYGMLAFALEQSDRLPEALYAGLLGAKLLPTDSWAHHGCAHALYFQARLLDGVHFLLKHAEHWEQCMSFMFTHNWFHVALMFVDMSDYRRALMVFDTAMWDISGATKSASSVTDSSTPSQPTTHALNTTIPLLTQVKTLQSVDSGSDGVGSDVFDSNTSSQHWPNRICELPSHFKDQLRVNTQLAGWTTPMLVQSLLEGLFDPSTSMSVRGNTSPVPASPLLPNMSHGSVVRLSASAPLGTATVSGRGGGLSNSGVSSLKSSGMRPSSSTNSLSSLNLALSSSALNLAAMGGSNLSSPLPTPVPTSASSSGSGAGSGLGISSSSSSLPSFTSFTPLSGTAAPTGFLSNSGSSITPSATSTSTSTSSSTSVSGPASTAHLPTSGIPAGPVPTLHGLGGLTGLTAFTPTRVLDTTRAHRSSKKSRDVVRKSPSTSSSTTIPSAQIQDSKNPKESKAVVSSNSEAKLVGMKNTEKIEPVQHDTNDMIRNINDNLKVHQPQSFSTNMPQNDILPSFLMGTPKLFARQDKSKSQDQMGAIGILWKMEMRISGQFMIPPCGERDSSGFNQEFIRLSLSLEDKKQLLTRNQLINIDEALIPTAAYISMLSSSSQDSQGLDHVADEVRRTYIANQERLRLSAILTNSSASASAIETGKTLEDCHVKMIVREFDSRWKSIMSYLRVNSQHNDPFFDIMASYCIGRSGNLELLHTFVSEIGATAKQAPVGRKEDLLRSVVPMCHAIEAYFNGNFNKAKDLLSPLLSADALRQHMRQNAQHKNQNQHNQRTASSKPSRGHLKPQGEQQSSQTALSLVHAATSSSSASQRAHDKVYSFSSNLPLQQFENQKLNGANPLADGPSSGSSDGRNNRDSRDGRDGRKFQEQQHRSKHSSWSKTKAANDAIEEQSSWDIYMVDGDMNTRTGTSTNTSVGSGGSTSTNTNTTNTGNINGNSHGHGSHQRTKSIITPFSNDEADYTLGDGTSSHANSSELSSNAIVNALLQEATEQTVFSSTFDGDDDTLVPSAAHSTDALAPVGGSSEQREVFSEFYLHLLFLTQSYEELLDLLTIKLRARTIPHLVLLKSHTYQLLSLKSRKYEQFLTKDIHKVPRVIQSNI